MLKAVPNQARLLCHEGIRESYVRNHLSIDVRDTVVFIHSSKNHSKVFRLNCEEYSSCNVAAMLGTVLVPRRKSLRTRLGRLYTIRGKHDCKAQQGKSLLDVAAVVSSLLLAAKLESIEVVESRI